MDVSRVKLPTPFRIPDYNSLLMGDILLLSGRFEVEDFNLKFTLRSLRKTL